jgi:hypothetical protein
MTLIVTYIPYARANHQTFKIPPIRELVWKYVGDGKGWIDPFAGDNSPCEYTNDDNEITKAVYHLEACVFCHQFGLEHPELQYKGVIIDPPYSKRQISEHYKKIVGRKATKWDTSDRFRNRVMNRVCDKVKPGGYAITCGWNSRGFGKTRKFELIELLLVGHGQGHSDTIVTVERKFGGGACQ